MSTLAFVPFQNPCGENEANVFDPAGKSSGEKSDVAGEAEWKASSSEIETNRGVGGKCEELLGIGVWLARYSSDFLNVIFATAPHARPPVCPRFSWARSPSAVGRCPLTCI